jgi:G3E family GTPase
MHRTRVTILAGYLGAGKTTLLNGLLRDTTEPLGVIVNDFGPVNVDAALVAGQTSVEGEVALQNGCICCTIRGDLLAALLSLLRRTDPPRHIVIETSGVSDPAAVARTFIDPRLADALELAAIVGCVDPSTFAALVGEDWALAAQQLRVCDFVELTKADATTEAERAGARALVHTLAPRARQIDGSLEHPPTELLLGTQVLWDRARAARSLPATDPPHVHEVGHAHEHHHHGGHAFESWAYRTERTLSTYALRRALVRLPREIFRAKGFVYAAEDPGVRLLVQVVGGRAELRAEGSWGTSTPGTELVFLAREKTLPVEALQRMLDGCRHDGHPSGEAFMQEMLGYFNRLLSGLPGHRE